LFALERGLKIAGFYHSHPGTGGRASRFDVEHAWAWYCYLIISVVNSRSVGISAWRLRSDRSNFVEEELIFWQAFVDSDDRGLSDAEPSQIYSTEELKKELGKRPQLATK